MLHLALILTLTLAPLILVGLEYTSNKLLQQAATQPQISITIHYIQFICDISLDKSIELLSFEDNGEIHATDFLSCVIIFL